MKKQFSGANIGKSENHPQGRTQGRQPFNGVNIPPQGRGAFTGRLRGIWGRLRGEY